MPDQSPEAEIARLNRRLAHEAQRRVEAEERAHGLHAQVAQLSDAEAAESRHRAAERADAEAEAAAARQSEAVAAAPALFRANVAGVVALGLQRGCYTESVSLALDARVFDAAAGIALSDTRSNLSIEFGKPAGAAVATEAAKVQFGAKIYAATAQASSPIAAAENIEAARLDAILRAPAAEGREGCAASLAFDTNVTAAVAVQLLAARPKAVRPMTIAERAAGLPEAGGGFERMEGLSRGGGPDALRQHIQKLNHETEKGLRK